MGPYPDSLEVLHLKCWIQICIRIRIQCGFGCGPSFWNRADLVPQNPGKKTTSPILLFDFLWYSLVSCTCWAPGRPARWDEGDCRASAPGPPHRTRPGRAPTGTRLPTFTDQGTVFDTLQRTRPCRAPTWTRLPTFTRIKGQFLIPYNVLVHVGHRLERACQHSRIKEQFLIPYTM